MEKAILEFQTDRAFSRDAAVWYKTARESAWDRNAPGALSCSLFLGKKRQSLPIKTVKWENWGCSPPACPLKWYDKAKGRALVGLVARSNHLLGGIDMLQLCGVCKNFRKRQVLREVSCEIGEGVYGLLGPNGAGKTTLMRCVVGLYGLQGGQILFDGKDVAKDGGIAGRIGYLPQKFGLFKELKVYNMLEYFATLKNIPREGQRAAIEKSLEVVNLTERAGDRVGALSGGMIRRLGIAQAVLGEPDVILFDEPTAGLDPEERMRFKNIVSSIKGGRTILISTHIVEDVEAVCDHILVMDGGEIIASGTDAEVREKARGKVFLLPEAAQLPAGSFVEKRLEGEEGTLLRVLAPTPVKEGRPAEPTVEDGYMALIKKI